MSTYPVLDDKPIDQWRVTELKEELKRRKLPVRGLKDDLIRRLDEALREESEAAKEPDEYSNDDGTPPVDEVEPDKAINFADETGKKNQESEKTGRTVTDSDNKDEETGDVRVESGNSKIQLGGNNKSQAEKDNDMVSLGKENALEDSTAMEESKMSVKTTSIESDVTVSENILNETWLISESLVNETGSITESMVNETGLSGEDLKIETENKKEESNLELKIEDTKSSDVKTQVYEVSEVKSESIYTNNTTITTTTTSTNNIMTVNEKKEQPKENIISDDVKLVFDVKQLPSENIIVDDGKLLVAIDNDDVQDEERKKNEIDCREGTGGDVELIENINVDQSFGEDSMEEDSLETKENYDLKLSSDDILRKGDGVNSSNLSAEAEKISADFESKNEFVVPDVKRKFNGGGHESEVNNDSHIDNNHITKRQRRWNSEGKNLNMSTNTTNAAALTKSNFSRSDSAVSEEPPRERVVPPSSKPSTTSLRIDRFLRPFTLKAVQEFLGKTGRVTSFWMDNIKTHCYVTYSSVEEAEETRNAVYNLQWPPNGGRLLVAEFVDPQELKTRIEAPPPSAAPTTTAPPLRPLPPPPPMTAVPSPRMQRQQLPPPPSLPPPPPLHQSLPPPPALPERVEPPIMTLDDLFRKTKATPRIYYLPLTDVQVEHKMAQAKTASTT